MVSSTGTPVWYFGRLSICATSSSAQVVRRVAGQYVHCGDQLRVSVHHNRRLVTVEASTVALAAVAKLSVLSVMQGHRPVPAHRVIRRLRVLEQQPVRVGHNPGQQGLPRPLVRPVDGRFLLR